MAKKETSITAKKKAVTPKKKPTIKKIKVNDSSGDEVKKITKPYMIGNKFWQLRSKHGRDRLFASPELLWESACEYFEWCDNNPLIAEEAIKSGELAGTTMKVPRMRVYNIQGLTRMLDCNVDYITDFEDSLKGKTDELSLNFSRVIKKIREVIYQNKYEGASSGFFNPLVISRDLGLRDSVDQNLKADVKSEVNLTQQSKVEITLPDNNRGLPDEIK